MSAQQRLNWASLLSAPQAATVKLQRSPFGPSSGQQQQQQQQQKQEEEGAGQAAAAAATPRQQQPPPSQAQQAHASSCVLLPILLLKVAMPQPDDEHQATSLRADTPLEQQLSKLRELQAQSASLLAAAAAAAAAGKQQQQQAHEQQQQDATEQALQDAVAPLLARPIPRPEHVPAHDRYFWTGGEPPEQQGEAGDGEDSGEAASVPRWLQQQQQQQQHHHASSTQPSSMSTGQTFPIRRSSGGGGGGSSTGMHDGVQSMATSVTTRHDAGRPGSGNGSAGAAARSQWASSLARLQHLRLATEQVLQQAGQQ